ncbi:hypothetical protein [Streptomyces olivochromogenes]|uniref:hypothetical protein n=1 Tax=Streptomyces olivochromogenes TaxID=1963 RepID=UPI001F1B1AE9|nr:hypothetical protein [Streptomyces olivochromogenes]MCF3131502.1 hypothetical protein [Streptomyces olivochromogenes]
MRNPPIAEPADLRESAPWTQGPYGFHDPPSVKRRVLTTALVGALTAGTVIATVQPRPTYWALTDRRLLFVDARTATGRPGKLLMALPRELMSLTPMRKALLGLGMQTSSLFKGWSRT